MEKLDYWICDHCKARIEDNAPIKISYKRYDFCNWNCHNNYFDEREDEDKNKNSES